MCFSAEASFGASAVLLGIGIASQYKAQSVPQRVLACMPLLFSFQQLNEGILWLSFSDAVWGHWGQISMYTFLVFAQVVWPIFVPFSMLLPEKNPVSKKVLKILLAAGILLSSYLLYCLFTYHVTATVTDHHIRYDLYYPHALRWYVNIFYFIAAVLPPLLSGNKFLRLIGATIVLAFLISRVWYAEYVISVWCYFAAIISVLMLAAIHSKSSTLKMAV